VLENWEELVAHDVVEDATDKCDLQPIAWTVEKFTQPELKTKRPAFQTSREALMALDISV
ncbi:unnamed protein product, partial [marine sediment metagenome]